MKKKEYGVGPIFIVGMNGSGTTMVADCLNNHPSIFVPRFESKTIPYFYLNQKKYGDLSVHRNFEKLLSDFSNTHIFRILSGNSKSVKIEYCFEDIQNKSLAGIIDLTFNHFAKKNGKKIWGDHSPKYGFCLNIIGDLFPACKVIHVIRDVRDCALSLNRRFKQNVSRTALQWKNIVRAGRIEGKRLGPHRYFEIRYEELTFDPDRHMRLLFDFLELPFDKIVMKSTMPMFQKSKMNEVDVNSIVPNSGKWKSNLSVKQVKNIEKISGKTLKDFNYEVKFFEGDTNISPLQLFGLKIFGKTKAAFIVFKEDKGKKRLSRLFRVGLSSLKQMRYFKY